MFFLLSKILTFLISPFTYIFVLLIWAFFSKNSRRQKKLLSITIILVFFFGNRFILDEVTRLWEMPVSKSKSKHYDIAIVLSGMIEYDAKNDIKKFNGNADRILQALPKLNKKEIDYLLFTGGSGDINHPENKEAELLKEYLHSINWDTSNWLFESKSRNTYENALYSAKMLKEIFTDLESKSILIITSSSHMRRSLACFKKQNIQAEYLSTNRFVGPRKFEFQHCLIPQSHVFNAWTHLGHEIIGYLTYKLTDKI